MLFNLYLNVELKLRDLSISRRVRNLGVSNFVSRTSLEPKRTTVVNITIPKPLHFKRNLDFVLPECNHFNKVLVFTSYTMGQGYL